MIPATMAIPIPVTTGDKPNAFLKEEPIEFACTIFPINPNASTTAIEKKVAKNFPKFPLNTWELEIEQGQLTHENIQNHVLNLRVFNTDFVNDNIFNNLHGIMHI